MKFYRTYAFDLDGTLIDTREAYRRSLLKTIEVTGEGQGYAPLFDSFFGMTCEDAVKLLGVTDAAGYEETWQNFFIAECSRLPLYPHMEETLNKLIERGAKIYVVTSRGDKTMLPLLKHPALQGKISGTVTYSDVSAPKPDKDALLQLKKKYGVTLSDTLMIGDSNQDSGCAQNAFVDFAAPGWNPMAVSGEGIHSLKSPLELLDQDGESQ